jgi:hypothetical protein
LLDLHIFYFFGFSLLFMNFQCLLADRRKANWIGHILLRKCLLQQVIEGKVEGRIEMTGRRGRRRKQLLHVLKEKRRYWKLKEEALDRRDTFQKKT